jgi:hypothetical protein
MALPPEALLLLLLLPPPLLLHAPSDTRSEPRRTPHNARRAVLGARIISGTCLSIILQTIRPPGDAVRIECC